MSMNHRWEFGPEYQRLSDTMRRARREGDDETIKRMKPRLDELKGMMWQTMVAGFPELTPYLSLVEALEKLCLKNGLLFPDLNDGELNFTGKGDWKESGRFIFGVGNERRSIQIFPMEDRHYIDVELYEGEACYKGQTSSVEDSAKILSKWYLLGSAIKEIHREFSWMPIEPFRISGPRVTYE